MKNTMEPATTGPMSMTAYLEGMLKEVRKKFYLPCFLRAYLPKTWIASCPKYLSARQEKFFIAVQS